MAEDNASARGTKRYEATPLRKKHGHENDTMQGVADREAGNGNPGRAIRMLSRPLRWPSSK